MTDQNSTYVPDGFACFTYGLKHYAQFSGRARRREYWYFILFYVLINIGLSILDRALGLYDLANDVGLLSTVFGLFMIIPTLAVAARRLHDTGRTAWWLLIGLIPLLGTIVLIVFMVQDSKESGQAYGEARK